METDTRLSALEHRLQEIATAIESLSRRLTTLEAQVDYVASKIRPA